MRILLVHNDYRKFSGEEHALNMVKKVLEENGHLLSWYRRTSEGIEESITGKIHAFFAGIYSLSSKRNVARLLDEEEIDLVQVQNLYPFISGSILPLFKARNIPVVMRYPNFRLFCPNGLHLSHGKICERCLGGKEWNCAFQNCEENIAKSIGYAARGAFARITRLITDNVTYYMVLSEFVRQRYIEGGIPAERISVLPNVAPDVKIDPDAPVGETVGFAGRISPEKGVYDFLEVARRLPDIKFSMAGSTNAMPGIQDEAPGNVHFTGFLSGQELDNFYRQSRLLVFPTLWYEAFPNALAQAMAFGKPVVASRLGVMQDIVDDQVTGLFSEAGNALDLAEKIEYLWSRPELCKEMGSAGLEKARREYSIERFYDRLIGAYRAAIDFNNQSVN